MARLRHECKFWINRHDIRILRRRLDRLFPKDSNSGEDGEYVIRSLYFDNYSDIALREKIDGAPKREKFRIRYYNDNPSFMRLEKKSKIDGLCLKEQCPITADECRRILDGDYHWMAADERELIRELYAKMNYKQLRPKNVVVYDRCAYVYEPGNCRITLDMNIRGSMNIYGFLNPNERYMRFSDNNVFEVKWDDYLPDIVRSAVQLQSNGQTSFSKYAVLRFV